MQDEATRIQAAIDAAGEAAAQMEKQQKWLQQEMSQLEVKIAPEQQSRPVQVCSAQSRQPNKLPQVAVAQVHELVWQSND